MEYRVQELRKEANPYNREITTVTLFANEEHAREYMATLGIKENREENPFSEKTVRKEKSKSKKAFYEEYSILYSGKKETTVILDRIRNTNGFDIEKNLTKKQYFLDLINSMPPMANDKYAIVEHKYEYEIKDIMKIYLSETYDNSRTIRGNLFIVKDNIGCIEFACLNREI